MDVILGGTLQQELYRTAEMLVEIADSQGIYFAVAFLNDSSYDLERIRALLPILEKTKGAVKIDRNEKNRNHPK